jgi:SRSO17 transposase
MVGVVTAEDIAGWDEDLRCLTDGLGSLFTRAEPRVAFAAFLRALMADVARKNSWGLAEHAGLDNPRGFERLLNHARWDVERLRASVRDLAAEHLGGPEAVLIFDDTSAIKKGVKSVGVAPQYCGLTGQVENCQAWVMLSLASEHGHTFIDRELYLPEAWTDDRERCRRAGVPADREFATKPALATSMLERATVQGVPFGWAAGDSGYGRDPDLRKHCHDNSVRYVLAVPVDLPLVECGQPIRPDTVLPRVPDGAWERRSCGDGTKGTRYYDWFFHRVRVKGQPPADGFEHTLMIRRSTAKKVTKKNPDGKYEIEYFLVHAPIGTPMPVAVRIAGMRWKIEENNETGKDLLGLDQYQVRNWTPTLRHVTICMLALAFLATTRARLGKADQPVEAIR